MTSKSLHPVSWEIRTNSILKCDLIPCKIIYERQSEVLSLFAQSTGDGIMRFLALSIVLLNKEKSGCFVTEKIKNLVHNDFLTYCRTQLMNSVQHQCINWYISVPVDLSNNRTYRYLIKTYTIANAVYPYVILCYCIETVFQKTRIVSSGVQSLAE